MHTHMQTHTLTDTHRHTQTHTHTDADTHTHTPRNAHTHPSVGGEEQEPSPCLREFPGVRRLLRELKEHATNIAK